MTKKLNQMLTSAFCLVVVMLLLTSCGAKKEEQTKSPEQTIKEFGEAFSKEDWDAAGKCVSGGSEFALSLAREEFVKGATSSGASEEMAQKLADAWYSAKIEPISAKITGDKAIVKTKVEVVDFMSLTGEIIKKSVSQEALDDKEFDKIFMQIVNSKDKPTKSSEVDVVLIKDGDNWVIDSENNMDFILALSSMG